MSNPMHDWASSEMKRWTNEARQYLEEHPEEAGVVIEPVIILPDGTEWKLEPMAFGRKTVEEP